MNFCWCLNLLRRMRNTTGVVHQPALQQWQGDIGFGKEEERDRNRTPASNSLALFSSKINTSETLALSAPDEIIHSLTWSETMKFAFIIVCSSY